MSRHEALVRLRHMLDHGREARDFARGKARRDLDSDRMLNLALVRLLEIVGEAASRVPADERPNYPGIEWPGIINLRHRLAHGYDDINYDILWSIIHKDLPPLIAELEKILEGCKP